jgi:hypothetical protein
MGALAIALAPAASADDHDEPPRRPSGAECQGVPPAALQGLADTGEQYEIHVRVLVEGLDAARASELAELAAKPYRKIGVILVYSFEQVAFQGVEVDELLEQSRERFGGARPSGIDLVHLITSKDVLYKGTDTYAGAADCIGGIRFPEYGFSFSEDDPTVERRDYYGVRPYPYWAAGVMAHEVGHEMGAQHHDGNCVEGTTSDPRTPCTVMEPAIRFRGLHFGIAERTAIRALATEGARG